MCPSIVITYSMYDNYMSKYSIITYSKYSSYVSKCSNYI